MYLIKEKIKQAASILNELDIDLWMVAVRETSLMSDPVLPLVIGEDVVWQSFFIFTRDGETAALVGNFDRDLFARSGRFDEVVTYTQEAGTALRKLVKQFNPQKIAINYSTDNPAADGLTHGMFLMLYRYLADTPYRDRLVSAQNLCSKLRSRKLPAEIDLLSDAAKATCAAWDRAMDKITPGLTEIEIAGIVDNCLVEACGQPSFPTIVNAGDKSDPGHGRPTDAKLEPGDLLHVDFGIRLNDFCSDIQRLIYFRKSAKDKPPQELVEAFDVIKGIIDASADVCRPGIEGWEVDAAARKILVERGYPEYQHALGHQLGRDPHDGGAVLGPKWDRYGTTPMIPLEIGNVFTLELGVRVEGIGYVGLEEDVALEETGVRFLCPRQEKLIVK
jgi:Xaa-Pro aminopeptidase